MKDLERIALADIDPDEAYPLLKRHLCPDDADGAEAAEQVYEALRSMTFTFVSGRVGGEEVRKWADLLLRVRCLARNRGSVIEERLTALYDLLDQTARLEGPRAIPGSSHPDVAPNIRPSMLEALTDAGLVFPGVIPPKVRRGRPRNRLRISLPRD
jgi:hypothetical protein